MLLWYSGCMPWGQFINRIVLNSEMPMVEVSENPYFAGCPSFSFQARLDPWPAFLRWYQNLSTALRISMSGSCCARTQTWKRP